MSEPVLTLRNVARSFASRAERVDVFSGIDLALAPGEALALTGESGSGKSTLLHLAAGLDASDAGEVHLDGQALSRLSEAKRARLRCRAVGLIFQQFNLIPALDVAANLTFQARLAGRADAARTARLVERLGLDGLMSRYPEELSGGQQQRLAIGRALAAGPALILADEPTGNLDEATGDGVLALMLDLVAETGAALLFVTHSPRLAARLPARRHLSGGQLT